MRVIVTGSRSYSNRGEVWSVLDGLYRTHGGLTVVHGACPTGTDRHTEEWIERCVRYRIPVGFDRFPAEWDASGRAAGPLRNRRMVSAGADLLVAFLAPPPALNRGTLGCLALAEAAGIPVARYGWTPTDQPEQETLL